MSEINFSLDEDQQQLRKWVHGFAEDVVRPAAWHGDSSQGRCCKNGT